jgi:integrase/recombinase XerD
MCEPCRADAKSCEPVPAAELSTTQIYTQVSIRKLKEIDTATHPGKQRQRRPATALAADEATSNAQQVLAALAAEALEDGEADGDAS